MLLLWLSFTVFCTTTTDVFAGVLDSEKCLSTGVWTWVCNNEENRCMKVSAKSQGGSVVELNKCKLTCGKYSTLFPRPSGYTKIGKDTVPFMPNNLKLKAALCGKKSCPAITRYLINNAFNRFQNTLTNTYLSISNKAKRKPTFFCTKQALQRQAEVIIRLPAGAKNNKLTLETDESYTLTIASDEETIYIKIDAKTFFGARHALESASQLMAFRESHNSLQVVSSVSILNDKPAYPFRGLLIDTSRNYFSPASIMRIITAMSYDKMNTLHWHITDTQSFPIDVPSVPELQKYGMYSVEKVYSHEDVRRIVNHGLIHGVRVLPEFDQPAHVGEGWQWGPEKGYGNLTVCFKKEPWQNYCVEPPCGQLNPTNEKIYEVLGKIYKTYFELFQPDIYHAGGDEININCWNSTEEVSRWMKSHKGGVQEKDYLALWKDFVDKSSEKMYEANNNKELPLIIWSSHLTSQTYLKKYLDPKKHIIQIWEATNDKQIANIVKNGFKTIFSPWNTLYLDCGYGNWLVEGNNWCAPYKDWKILYQSDPMRILRYQNVTITDAIRKSVLGQEAAMWSEQVDEFAAEGKVWPRVSALAERLWTNPAQSWRDAEYRFIHHRERLVERGVMADAIQPLWCWQNPGYCYLNRSLKSPTGLRYMVPKPH